MPTSFAFGLRAGSAEVTGFEEDSGALDLFKLTAGALSLPVASEIRADANAALAMSDEELASAAQVQCLFQVNDWRVVRCCCNVESGYVRGTRCRRK